MKVLIDIPEEFATDYTADKFKEFFERVIADMDTLCGTYEKETADMFIEAFENSKPYDQDKVVEQLEDYLFERYCVEGDSEIERIVKGGGLDG